VKRHPLTAAAVAVLLSVTLGACSGGGSDDPKPSPSTSTSAIPATTPAPSPQPPAQPAGANGVTYEIQNWDQYATDPAVLAWKQTLEAFGGSINSGRLLEPVRAGMSKKALRLYVSSLEQARSGSWHVEPVGKVRIESAQTTGAKAKLTVCSWVQSVAFLTQDGTSPDGDENLDVWLKDKYELALRDGRWKITSAVNDGKCPGGPPA
jgi:hypothetical protein